MTEVLAIIPARSGSKGIPHKNIRDLDGQPLIAYSIQHALNSKLITRVIVSTDSPEYAAIAKSFGAEVPFIRPKNISGDLALDIEVFEHALEYLKQKENYVPELVVQLRPTYPIRQVQDIDKMIELLIDNPNGDSIRCISQVNETPYKMWFKKENGEIQPILRDLNEAYNMPRQSLPVVYYQNACIDVIWASVIMEKHSMTGEVILGYEMDENFDIDSEEDFFKAEQYLKLNKDKKRFVFDIDGVIAQFNKELAYENCLPNKKMVDVINMLYKEGHEIILFTARGYVTNKDWRDVTEKQMKEWGLQYHELHFGKPNADFYIDDKMLNMFDLMNKYLKR
ncbi:acylneuraminate cytidylyltransferase family protein [Solibacillus daqui]|uniref:acylneuraminate cytidylyltransferase family protein n=1 Tax=Solibacillus daqui TaxID=2912187 RepID=UPI002366AF51|nr:acylneuraminate cytidylyltransferase family protein [Solibacillus daqui]